MTHRASRVLVPLAFCIACSAAPEGSNGDPAGSGGTAASGPSAVGGSASSLGLGGSSSSSEACNGFDDDADGSVDEGCSCTPGTTQVCHPYATGSNGLGGCKPGTQTCSGGTEVSSWGPCVGGAGASPEICGNGVDDDCSGADQPCDGSGGAAGAGAGGTGGGTGCVPSAEICGNGLDEDCNGTDAPCTDVCQSIFLLGDCLTVSCPSNAPYPKSCNVFFTPGDDRGCVANAPNSSVVYFQAGDACNQGLVTGELCCSATPQAPLTQQNCPINKPIQYHVTTKEQCPEITD